jgi:hypothetical protein
VIDSAGDYHSRHENGLGYFLTLDDIVTSDQRTELSRQQTRTTRFGRRRPIRATDLSGLAAAGVDVFAKDYPGMIHTFASLYAISVGADQALGELLRRVPPSSADPALGP